VLGSEALLYGVLSLGIILLVIIAMVVVYRIWYTPDATRAELVGLPEQGAERGGSHDSSQGYRSNRGIKDKLG